MRAATCICLILSLQPVYAQQVLSSLAAPVSVNGAACRRAVAYVPPPDVAYKPGVDVHGKAVAPADLPGSRMDFVIPETIQFNFSINPTNYGLTATQAQQKSQLVTGNNSSLPVAAIAFDLARNQLTINGHPLTNSDQAALTAACQQQAGKK